MPKSFFFFCSFEDFSSWLQIVSFKLLHMLHKIGSLLFLSLWFIWVEVIWNLRNIIYSVYAYKEDNLGNPFAPGSDALHWY